MRRTLFNLTIALLISGIIITALPGQIALAATHIVAKDGSGDFTIIQNAINFASSGDTITVKEGTYNEWLTIDKPLTLQGENRDTTILEAPTISTKDGITIDNVSGVTIRNLTIRKYRFEIYLKNSHNNVITNNIFEDRAHLTVDYCGIRTTNADNNIISDNIFQNNEYGIYLHSGSEGNIIDSNTFYNNNIAAVKLNTSSNNEVVDNTVVNNAYGIDIEYNSNGNIVENNNITNNTVHGVRLFRCSANEILNNTISDNSLHGILLSDAYDSEILGNDIIRNGSTTDIRYGGITITSEYQVFPSTGNIIADNIISDHPQKAIMLITADVTDTKIYNNTIEDNNYGIYILNANNSLVYHNNIINNVTSQAVDSNPASNNWHEPDLLEGNYWSDYAGVDNGSGTDKHAIAGDGIGDTLIPHPGVDFDNYPFTTQSGWEAALLISATVDVKPDTLNLNSKGKWITAYIELPGGYDVADIDIATVLLDDTVTAEPSPTEIGDYDSDGIADLMVKFDRQEVIDELEWDWTVVYSEEITITLNLNDGTAGEGSDTIKVLPKENKGKGNPNKGSKPEKGGGQDNGNGNPNPGQGNNQGGGNDNPNSGQGNNQGGENGNSNPGQGNGNGKGNK